MSKAERIRALLDVCTPREIAEQVGCRVEYVRAVRSRHLKPELHRSWDMAYKARNPEYRAKNAAASRRWYHRKKLQAA